MIRTNTVCPDPEALVFFTPPSATTRHATVSELKNNLARTLDDALAGTETVVTRHARTVAVVIPPSAHNALTNFRRAVRQAFESSLRCLERMRSGSGRLRRPSADVIGLMETLLEELRGQLDVGPGRTVETAEGGIDTYFFSAERTEDGSPARYVSVGVDPDGSASVLFSDGPDATAEDLCPGSDARHLAARITEFLSGAENAQPA